MTLVHSMPSSATEILHLAIAERNSSLLSSANLSSTAQIISVDNLENLLADDSQKTSVQVLAALQLGRFGGLAARRALLSNLATATDDVADQIIQSLGQIGTVSEMNALLQEKDTRPAFVRRSTKFAIALIAHRNALPIPDTCLLSMPKYYAIPKKYRIPFNLERPSTAKLDCCLVQVAADQMGIEIAKEYSISFEYEDEQWVVLPNRHHFSVDERSTFLAHNSIFALIAERDLFRSSYFIALVVLFSRNIRTQSGTLRLYTPEGVLVYIGEAHLDTKQTIFSIRTVRNMGVNPLEIEGEIGLEGFNIQRADTAETTVPIQLANKAAPGQKLWGNLSN